MTLLNQVIIFASLFYEYDSTWCNLVLCIEALMKDVSFINKLNVNSYRPL